MKHEPVMYKEIIDWLITDPKGIYVDATYGSGGHSLGIKSVLDSEGRLIAIDIDKQNVENASDEVEIVNANFKDIQSILSEKKIKKVDGILADLGWSSDQLESLPGLSYLKEDFELDMRLDKELGVTAADLLNALGRRELEIVFRRYADFSVSKARRLTEEITKSRAENKIKYVGDFNEIVQRTFGQYFDNGILSRVYQALRIAVNDEFTNLDTFIKDSLSVLKPGGRLLIITFHSGEENIVNELFTKYKKGSNYLNLFKESYKQPTLEEITRNIRSRSAKLWGIEKNTV